MTRRAPEVCCESYRQQDNEDDPGWLLRGSCRGGPCRPGFHHGSERHRCQCLVRSSAGRYPGRVYQDLRAAVVRTFRQVNDYHPGARGPGSHRRSHRCSPGAASLWHHRNQTRTHSLGWHLRSPVGRLRSGVEYHRACRGPGCDFDPVREPKPVDGRGNRWGNGWMCGWFTHAAVSPPPGCSQHDLRSRSPRRRHRFRDRLEPGPGCQDTPPGPGRDWTRFGVYP